MSEAAEIRPRNGSPFAKLSRGLKRFRRNPLASFLIDLVVIVGAALILSVLIKAFLIRSFYIPSGSMLDTLQINDRIIVNVLVPDAIPVERGDIIVFKDPGGWLGAVPTIEKTTAQELSDFVLGTFGITAPDSAEHLVKRVIGMPGDVVTCCDEDGRIMVNGVGIDEVYLKPGVTPSDIEFSVEVPAGQYWVMGDNRPNSTDSRYHQDLPTKGFVPEGIVVGRALVISWPFDNWTYLDNYSEVFGGVPKP